MKKTKKESKNTFISSGLMKRLKSFYLIKQSASNQFMSNFILTSLNKDQN